jgi:hypothetical protein
MTRRGGDFDQNAQNAPWNMGIACMPFDLQRCLAAGADVLIMRKNSRSRRSGYWRHSFSCLVMVFSGDIELAPVPAICIQ